MGCNCRTFCCLKMRLQEYFQLFFWFGMLVGMLSPIVIYYHIYLFFDIWPVIQRFFVLFSVNSSWLMLMSPIGYFLLQGKIANKVVSAAYSVCLCMVIVFAMVVIAFSQAQSVNMDDPEGSVVLGIRDYFDENGNIPNWLHDLQATDKCCGFSSGPEDWRKLIYPPDKPAIEDVPESCCITRVVGCNLILDAFKNKSELKHWVYTDGCRKPIERRLNSLLDIVSCGEIVMLVVGVILISIYWINLNEIFRQSNDDVEPTQENENPEEFTATGQEELLKSNDPNINNNINNNNGVEEMEGCSESESPAAMPGSDLNSRRASLMAFSPGRSVQFRPSRNRLVITKSKSETNALNNNNNNTITTVTATTTDNNTLNNIMNNNNINNISSRNNISRSKSRNNIINSRTMINQGSNVSQSINRSKSMSNKQSTKSQVPTQSQKQVPFQVPVLVAPSRKQSSKSQSKSKKQIQSQRQQMVLQEIIIDTDDGEVEEGEEYNNEEEEEDEDPGDRLNVRPVKTSSRIISRKNSGPVGNNSRSNSKSRIRSSNSNKSVSNNKNSSTSTRRASSKSNQ